MRAIVVAAAIGGMIIGAAGFALAIGGCASGLDGQRQACANVDEVLTSSYQLATAGMKTAISEGKAKTLLGCFEDLVASLDAVGGAKTTACANATSAGAKDAIAKATQAAADIAAAAAKFQSCKPGGG